jgi:hypothetical protein
MTDDDRVRWAREAKWRAEPPPPATDRPDPDEAVAQDVDRWQEAPGHGVSPPGNPTD